MTDQCTDCHFQLDKNGYIFFAIITPTLMGKGRLNFLKIKPSGRVQILMEDVVCTSHSIPTWKGINSSRLHSARDEIVGNFICFGRVHISGLPRALYKMWQKVEF